MADVVVGNSTCIVDSSSGTSDDRCSKVVVLIAVVVVLGAAGVVCRVRVRCIVVCVCIGPS